MSLGLKKAGFDIKWAVDNDHLAAATLRANAANTDHDMKLYTEDAKMFLKKSIQGHPCYPKAAEVDHIHASPPCKGFSRANRNGGRDDLRNNKVRCALSTVILLDRDLTKIVFTSRA